MRRARPGHGALARWRAWLHGPPPDDPASDEQEEMTAPPGQDPDGITRSPPASLDEVLREAAEMRDPRNGRAGGQGSPTAT